MQASHGKDSGAARASVAFPIKLKTAEQLIHISVSAKGVNRPGFSNVETIKGLAVELLAPSPDRAHGVHSTQPVLVCANAGTGKTWSSVQLIHELASCCKLSDAMVPLVPALVCVQRLARILHERPDHVVWR